MSPRFESGSVRRCSSHRQFELPDRSIAPGKNALDVSPALSAFITTRTTAPADIGTYLHFLGVPESLDLVRWGYLVSDGALLRYFVPRPSPATGIATQALTMEPSRRARVGKATLDTLPF
jgi:hypothetical protein